MTAVRPLSTSTYSEMRLPLIGLYPVVTWQLNLTLHQATGLSKFVSIVREPSDHVEIRRDFSELEQWAITRPRLTHLIGLMPDDLASMVGHRIS